ncbi:MAG: hypothetical protein ABSD59_24940 [Terracidiphilus sp.]
MRMDVLNVNGRGRCAKLRLRFRSGVRTAYARQVRPPAGEVDRVSTNSGIILTETGEMAEWLKAAVC